MLPELHSILNLLEGGFSQLKILVVGDIMLDRYIHGEVERISPEAPVPVLRHAQRYERAGGAANVAMNLAGSRMPVDARWLLGIGHGAGRTCRVCSIAQVSTRWGW